MTFHDRFPQAWTRIDFSTNLIILAFDFAFVLFLLWDVFFLWRKAHITLRVGTTVFMFGALCYRLYAIWALWHFHPNSLSRERLDSDFIVTTANLIFIACWLADPIVENARRRKEDVFRRPPKTETNT